MPVRTLPLRAVAAFFLGRQHLARPREAALTPPRLRRFAEDVGGIQLDSINVVDRAHYLTVWSRFGPYDRASLDRLVYGRRLLFEYWAHAACLVPTAALPFWRRAMLGWEGRHDRWAAWARGHRDVLHRVRAAIAARGPMGSADFGEEPRPSGESGWWNWKPVQYALQYLFMNGELTVHSRRHFHKRFDLLERAIPAAKKARAVSPEEFAVWHVVRSLHAMGAATEKDLAWYLSDPRFKRDVRRAAIRTLIERGEAAEVNVEGQTGKWLALTRDLPAIRRAGRAARPSSGTTIVAPFDSFMWHRERVRRLFGFEYQIEVYTPGHQRVHGYYTMPVLHDGELIGRVDAKTHRAERLFEVRHAHFEPWFAAGKAPPGGSAPLDPALAMKGVAEALRSLAVFVGADDLAVRRATPGRLRAGLARALSAP